MFAKPNNTQMRQLARLSTPEFADLILLFEQELSIIQGNLVDVPDEIKLRQLQGRGQGLSELLKLIRKAPELTTTGS